MSSKSRRVLSFLGTACKGIGIAARIAVSVIAIAVLIALLALLLHDDTPEVPKEAALIVNPAGSIVDQLGGDPVQDAIDAVRGTSAPETLLKDLVDAIDAARDDERIQVLVLDLNRMGGAGMSKLQTLRETIAAFKESGKRVVATADTYSQGTYYLAAQADEVHLHHMGMLLIEGFGRYKMYFRDLLDRLEIDYHIFRVGTYKSAVEPYLRDDMSEAARKANLEWLGDLWQAYLNDVAEARQMPIEALKAYIDEVVPRLRQADGDSAKIALDAGLVDHLATRDTFRERLVELVGEDEDTHSFHQIDFSSYLETLDDDRFGEDASGDQVAVIVARGQILNGNQPPGKIGGDSTAALIRQARNDDDVKAIVLRVDSGGGSAFASEVIRRELELAREQGLPVVASMGSVAASGGYWVTMAADEVWALPTTITGSIGIFGMFPTYQKPLAKHLGVRVDGVGTTWLSGVRPDRELPEQVGDAIQLMIEQGYADFIGKVAEARDMTLEEVDRIAQGRVWSGEDAHDLGLLDHLGGLDEAIASAATLAELEGEAGDGFEVRYITKKLDLKDRIVRDLLARAATLLPPTQAELSTAPWQPRATEIVRELAAELERIESLNDPRGVYAYWPCEHLQ
jgi:protease-4